MSSSSYIGALNVIREIVVNDIMNTDNQKPRGNELAQSKYIVCFLSDGLTDCEESIMKTQSFVADADADCIPDGIEMASGTNMFENSHVDVKFFLLGKNRAQNLKTSHLYSPCGTAVDA